MFVFGHVGLTWGGGVLLAKLPVARRAPAAAIDCRFLILGSMLPDLIDKPLGVFILSGELGNGRIFAHSLAFVLLVLLAAVIWRRAAGKALVALGLGSAAHLVMDRLWEDPQTLLWPLLGLRPEREDVSGWSGQMLDQLLTDPYTYVSEAVGAAIVAGLVVSLLARRGGRDSAAGGRAGWIGGGGVRARLRGGTPAAGSGRPAGGSGTSSPAATGRAGSGPAAG